MRALVVTSLATAGLALGAGAARADRPLLAGAANYGVTGGDVLVHYATTGEDAPPTDDADGDGVPDFVAQVAAISEDALDRLRALGFRRPLDDGALGGDARIDIYLADLMSADGNVSRDSCTAGRCIGYAIAENDFAGYAYATREEAIESVVPHELFHLIQLAYSDAQPANWSEGTAVWAVEHLYGDGNADFERFLPGFLGKSFRPFERSGSGFGDAYPYGAALWPYFLDLRFGAATLVAAWERCEGTDFLTALDGALSPATTVDAAFTEFTRWNALTGARDVAGGYAAAATWPEAPGEPALAGAIGATSTIQVEGLSARYVPVELTERASLTVAPGGQLRVAAWTVRDGDGLEGGMELAAVDGGALATTLPPGRYTLVVTGLSRNTLATPVVLALGEPAIDAPPADDDEGGGCRASDRRAGSSLALIMLALAASLTATAGTRRAPRDRSH